MQLFSNEGKTATQTRVVNGDGTEIYINKKETGGIYCEESY